MKYRWIQVGSAVILKPPAIQIPMGARPEVARKSRKWSWYVPFMDNEECSLHYVQLPCENDPQAEHIVMVHGLAANLAFWYFQLAPELARDYNVTLYDLRGHGRSKRPELGYAPSVMAGDLRNLLDALGMDRVHVIAHSFGGQVALHFARQFPERVRTLTIADTHLSSERQNAARWENGEKLQLLLDQRGLELDTADPFFGYRMLTEAARIQLAGEDERTEAVSDWGQPFQGKAGKRSARQWLQLLESTTAGREIMEDDGLSDSLLAELQAPTLAVYGENSHALGSGKRLARLVPRVEFVVVPQAGHFFPASRPKVLYNAWSDFLRGTR